LFNYERGNVALPQFGTKHMLEISGKDIGIDGSFERMLPLLKVGGLRSSSTQVAVEAKAPQGLGLQAH
jgi:hypothetical protein